MRGDNTMQRTVERARIRPSHSQLTSHRCRVRPVCTGRAVARIVPWDADAMKSVELEIPATPHRAPVATRDPTDAADSASAAYTPPWTMPQGCNTLGVISNSSDTSYALMCT